MKHPVRAGYIVIAGFATVAAVAGLLTVLSAQDVRTEAALRIVTQEDIDAALPGIVCWGDSLTEGYLGDGVSYPDVLEQLIDERLIEPIREASGNEDLTAPKVVNLGVSGESTVEIAGRQGGIPLIVASDFVIPAECVSVKFEYCSSDGRKETELVPAGGGHVATITICGVEGYLLRWKDDTTGNYGYLFQRLEAGEAVDVSAGEYITVNADIEGYEDYLPVIMMGNNGGWSSNENLANQLQAMLNHSGSDRYIVAANPVNLETDADKMDSMDEYMEEVFGEQAISLRQWMIDNGLQTAAASAGSEVVISGEDATRMEAGLIPSSLMNEDLVHFTSEGYAVMAEMFYEKLEDLGYLDGLKALAQ